MIPTVINPLRNTINTKGDGCPNRKKATFASNMKKLLILILTLLWLLPAASKAQMVVNKPLGNLQRCIVVNGDTIILVQLRNMYCFPRRNFKSKKEEEAYWRDVMDVKRTLPLAKLVHGTMMETYEYLETLPDDKARDAHLKRMQKDLLEEYKPVLKKLNFRQGKLLVKLIDRECNSSSFDLVRAYLGSFAAGFWQGIGKVFGVSLKSEWDPNGKDKELERVCVMVEYGMI